MKFIVDHDYHIHSYLSLCSHDDEHTPARILQYAKEHGLKKICLTDHFWDETVPGASGWYQKQNYAHVCEALPLPTDPDVEFVLGCETDMDKFLTVGLAPEHYDRFGFIIIPTTHLHMKGFTIDADVTLEERAEAYVKRFDKVLSMDLPFHKVGIAHLTCSLLANATHEDHLTVLDMISDEEFTRLFTKAARVGVGIELNFPANGYSEAELPRAIRPYKIAKACGCKFYVGSDSHKVREQEDGYANLLAMVDLLDLEESDKFTF